MSWLQAGKGARTVELTKDEHKLIKGLGIITYKVWHGVWAGMGRGKSLANTGLH
jgi:hypothetical protein